MGCNANNHPADCRCGWGGDGHKGKSPGGRRGHLGHLPQSQTDLFSKVETENSFTRCPICQSEVVFIKHNGGSVWLDPPLGPPWYKHACFDTVNASGSRGRLKTSFDGQQKGFSFKTKIIVVASCIYNSHSATTRLKAHFDANEIYSFSVRGDARIFVGRLCFIDPSVKEVWPIDDHDKKLYYQGALSKHLSSDIRVNEKSVGIRSKDVSNSVVKNSLSSGIKCHICGDFLRKQQKYRKHLLNVHGVIALHNKGSYGFLVVAPNKFYPGYSDDTELKDESLPAALNQKKSNSVGLIEYDKLQSFLRDAFHACAEESGWASLADIGNWLTKERTEFKVIEYGYKKLSQLVNELDYISVKKIPMKNHSLSFQFYIKFIN